MFYLIMDFFHKRWYLKSSEKKGNYLLQVFLWDTLCSLRVIPLSKYVFVLGRVVMNCSPPPILTWMHPSCIYSSSLDHDLADRTGWFIKERQWRWKPNFHREKWNKGHQKAKRLSDCRLLAQRKFFFKYCGFKLTRFMFPWWSYCVYTLGIECFKIHGHLYY